MSTRRDFIKKSALTTAGLSFAMKASSYNAILGANDRVNLAYMGLGRRTPGYYPILNPEFNTKLLYLCDVKASQVTKTLENLKDKIDYKVKVEEDIRKVLKDKKLDAVLIATPDHWHAPASIMAMDAGKHVFVEKPCAHNPREGELLVEWQKKTGKLVQMGNQQRSSAHTIEIVKDIQNGIIGEPYKAIAYYSNQRGEVPAQVKQAPPADLNWDLFQGPAPRQEYFHDIWNYNWHWYGWNWGTAETGNNAIHELDIARWAMGLDFPSSVTVDADKNHFKEDGWEMYDTMYATFKFDDGKVINWDGKSRNGYNTYGGGRGTLIYGSNGSVMVDRGRYKLYDRGGKLIRENGGGNEGGVALGGGGDTTTAHLSNFIEGIRGKQALNSPIADGVKSNHLALMANIAYRTGGSLTLDGSNGTSSNDEVNKLWGRSYEPGWELK